MIKRKIYNALKIWKGEKKRYPILLRGARQIGKTYIINRFGKKEFHSFVTLNFERNKEFKEIFTTNDPVEIIEKITLYTGKKVTPGKTLLFLDEIQECPNAIIALRYFYEEMPDLNVIGAGSLLEFALKTKNFRMPVGRVQYLYMFPLSFGEFLDALGENKLHSHILDLRNLSNLSAGLHNKLIEYVKKYFILGGMPAVVSEYLETGDILKCQRIQQSIINTYSDDFAKYASEAKFKYLQKVFSAVPTMIGKKFVYSKIDDSIKSRELKEALELLEMAGVVRRVKRTSGAGLPLSAGTKSNFFKMIFLDVGLMHAMNGIYSETIREKDLTAIYKGAVAEQFAGQEIVSTQNPYKKPELFYWARDSKNSLAELDYIIEKKGEIIPLEIKSGAAGRMKSMKTFLDTYKIGKGLKISQAEYKKESNIISLPLYAIENLINFEVE